MIPAWILDSFAGLMLAVAAVSAGRLIAARARAASKSDTDVDTAHVLMGIAMAGMLASGLHTLPDSVWVAVFAVVTAWFGWRVAGEVRARKDLAGLATTHHAPHLLHGAAMIYMFVAVSQQAAASPAMAGLGGMAGSTGTLRVPTVGLVFILAMAGWAVWDIDQVSGQRRHRVSPAGGFAVPASLRHRIALTAAGAGQDASLAAMLAPAAAGTAVPGLAPAAVQPAALQPAAAQPGARQSGPVQPDATRPDPAQPVTGTGPADAGQRGLLDPRVATTCRIAMSVTMALMLVLML